MSENVSDYFNVGYDNIHYVIASESVDNPVTKKQDTLSQLPLLFPERNRIEFKSGNTECGESEEDPNGTKIVHSVLQGDKLVFKTIPSKKVEKSKAWTTSKYSVFINYTPSQGKFNCAILEDCKMTWTRKVFMIECDSNEQAHKMKDWLQSETIRQEVLKMFEAKNNAYTVSLSMLQRLPHYE